MGDAIEVGLSASMKVRGNEYWPKISVTVHVRPGETDAQAHQRGWESAAGFLTLQVNEITGE